MSASFLIIGQPGRLRDSLATILASFPHVDAIRTAEDFESGCQIAARQQPSAVIVDGGDYLKEDCAILKKLITRRRGCRCIIIVNTLEQVPRATSFGADAVLLQGFSTDALLRTLQALDILPQSSTGKVPGNAAQISLPVDQHSRKI